MGQALLNEVQDDDSCINEVTTESSEYLSFNTQIINIVKFLELKLSTIRKYIPDKKGIRASNCFELLILISANPRTTQWYLRFVTNSTGFTISKNVNYLLELSLIKQIGKPRLIVPFQKFKVDKGYVITPAGEKLLREILA